MTTVAVCMVVQDDLPFLDQAVKAAAAYADEIIVVDNGSYDGTGMYLLEKMKFDELGSRLKVITAPREKVLHFGFSLLKNTAAKAATSEWIHSLDSDERLDPSQVPLLKPFLERCRRNCVSIRTLTYVPSDWNDIKTCFFDGIVGPDAAIQETRHRRIYRRNSGIEWKGYIHEELFQGDENCMSAAECSDFKHQHFTNFRMWGDPEKKKNRYAWMLMKAYNDPELRKWTNPWWYNVHVPERLEELRDRAAKFDDIIKRGLA